MATSSGPKPVDMTGLVTAFDTSNPKGYSGSTLFNLGNAALNFSGNSSYVSSSGINSGVTWTSPSTNVLDTDYHSIFFKVKFNSTGTYPNAWTGSWNKLFGYTPPGTDRSPGIWRYPSERKIHWRYNPNNTGIDFGDNATFALNTWYFIGVTKDGSSATAYINGSIATTASVSSPKTGGNSTIQLMPGYPSDLSNMNNLYIFNRVLSSVEVSNLYTNLQAQLGI